MGIRILAVEDQPEVLDALGRSLRSDGHVLEVCGSAEEGLPRAREGAFDLYIIDVGLPGMTGFQFVSSLREEGNRTPAIMLTGEQAEDAKVEGLESGADDYVTKPFSVAEVRARINALLRRTRVHAGTVRLVGPFRLDLESHTVEGSGSRIRLTNREFGILWTLAEPPLRSWTRLAILDRVWEIDFDPETKVFDVHLSNLRRKLEPLENLTIEWIPEEGYLLRA